MTLVAHVFHALLYLFKLAHKFKCLYILKVQQKFDTVSDF